MDHKLILVNLITLLYRESEYEGKGVDNTSLVRSVADKIKVAESVSEVTSGRDSIVALRATVFWMLEQGTAKAFNRDDLIQRIRVNVADETHLVDAINYNTAKLETSEDVMDAISRVESVLRVELNKEDLKEAIKQSYIDTHFGDGEVDWPSLPETITGKIEPFIASMAGKQVHDEMLSEIDLGNLSSVADALQKARQTNSSEGVMRLGNQGFNAMLGQVGGLRRGDEVCIGALQHNYKSGLLLHWPRQVAMYNIPYMLDDTKKPLILHISLENSAEDNMMSMYKWLKENDTFEDFDVRDPDIDLAEAAQYVHDKLTVNGYHFKFLRFDPSNFTYAKLISLLRDYEREYEIHICAIDYLNMMSKIGCVGGTDSAVIRDLFRRVRNYCNPRGITLLTAHQLSSDAKNLIRNGCENFVKEVANKGYWADCKQIDQELDLEIIINLEKPGDGSTFLTAYRGKHRMPFITPEKDLYTVYKFAAVGSIPDDVNGESAALKKVGMGAMGEGDNLNWGP
jgi:hypothetical protein